MDAECINSSDANAQNDRATSTDLNRLTDTEDLRA